MPGGIRHSESRAPSRAEKVTVATPAISGESTPVSPATVTEMRAGLNPDRARQTLETLAKFEIKRGPKFLKKTAEKTRKGIEEKYQKGEELTPEDKSTLAISLIVEQRALGLRVSQIEETAKKRGVNSKLQKEHQEAVGRIKEIGVQLKLGVPIEVKGKTQLINLSEEIVALGKLTDAVGEKLGKKKLDFDGLLDIVDQAVINVADEKGRKKKGFRKDFLKLMTDLGMDEKTAGQMKRFLMGENIKRNEKAVGRVAGKVGGIFLLAFIMSWYSAFRSEAAAA